MVSWCKKGEHNALISPKSELSGLSGQTLTTNVSMTLVTGKFVTEPMSHVAALHLYRIKLGTKLIRSLRPL